MNNQEKRKIIQKALFFLHSSPNNNRKRKRKPYIRSFYLKNSKVFFDIFIPKILKRNVNDQYRRLKDLEIILPQILSRKPLLSGNRFIFSFKNYKAIVFSKDRVHKKRQYKKYYLLSFFPD